MPTKRRTASCEQLRHLGCSGSDRAKSQFRSSNHIENVRRAELVYQTIDKLAVHAQTFKVSTTIEGLSDLHASMNIDRAHRHRPWSHRMPDPGGARRPHKMTLLG